MVYFNQCNLSYFIFILFGTLFRPKPGPIFDLRRAQLWFNPGPTGWLSISFNVQAHTQQFLLQRPCKGLFGRLFFPWITSMHGSHAPRGTICKSWQIASKPCTFYAQAIHASSSDSPRPSCTSQHSLQKPRPNSSSTPHPKITPMNKQSSLASLHQQPSISPFKPTASHLFQLILFVSFHPLARPSP